MRKKGIALILLCSLVLSVLWIGPEAHAGSIGDLKTPSGTKTFYGEKRSIEFYLPVNERYYYQGANEIYVELKKDGKIVKKEYLPYSEEEWNDQRIVKKYKMSGAGTYTLWAAGQEIKFKVKKASDIEKLKPKAEVERGSGSELSIVINHLDTGTKAKIYRSTDGIKFKCIETTTASSYTDTSIKAGTVYYYKVRFYAKGGNKTYKSKLSSISEGLSLS